jgi:hypothetical protein
MMGSDSRVRSCEWRPCADAEENFPRSVPSVLNLHSFRRNEQVETVFHGFGKGEQWLSERQRQTTNSSTPSFKVGILRRVCDDVT